MGNKSAKGFQKNVLFNCQDVYSGKVAQVGGFTNVQQLYNALGTAFGYSANDILFCTVNTPSINMEALLTTQLVLSDKIFVHRKAENATVEFFKGENLGVTLTDNGAGCVFIKRVREPSIGILNVGEGIVEINGQNVTGWRHLNVANHLKNIPKGTLIKITVVRPLEFMQ